jgi:hypothetical protein
MHQIAGLLHVRTNQLMVAFDNVSANKDVFNVCWVGSKHQRCDLVAHTIKVWRAHVNNRNITLLARGEAPSFRVEIPDAGTVDRGEAEHVALM